MRTIFRQEINEKMKKVLMLFCDPNGQMINEMSIDLITLGKIMNENGITVTQPITQNMPSIMEAFGGICYV